MLAAHLLFLLADDSAALQRRRSRQDALKSYYSLADDPAPSSSEHATGTSSTGSVSYTHLTLPTNREV